MVREYICIQAANDVYRERLEPGYTPGGNKSPLRASLYKPPAMPEVIYLGFAVLWDGVLKIDQEREACP